MRSILIALQMLCTISICDAQSSTPRMEAEYYVAAYAKHYRVPVALARSIVGRESNWQVCTTSPQGAAGLMQLMPRTAQQLGVSDRCNPDQNVSGGVRYLAWLMQRFHGDLRLVVAAYYVGEEKIVQRGLAYQNSDVLAYVLSIRTAYLREAGIEPSVATTPRKRDVR